MSGMMMGVAGSPQLSRTGAMTGSHVCMCRWGYRRDGAGRSLGGLGPSGLSHVVGMLRGSEQLGHGLICRGQVQTS